MSHRLDVVRAAMTLDDRLDDIKRAQIWSELEPRLVRPVRTPLRWRAAVAAVGFAAALVATWLQLRPRAPEPHTLDAPADTTLAASLGPHTHAELVGPASLDVVGEPGDATSVRLRSGTLLAEFTGGPGRSLRVETNDLVVEIVGTLFSVETHATGTCVSVVHGKVRVTTRSGVVAVATGESWCSTLAQLEPIASPARRSLERFAAVITARDDAEPPAPAPPSPAPPALPSLAPPAPPPPPAVDPVVQPAVPPPPHEPVAVPRVTRRPVTTPPVAAPPVAAMPSAAADVPADLPATPPIASAPAPSAPVPAPSAPVPAPRAPVPPPVLDSPEALYEAAEAALGSRDPAGADRMFARLLAAYPHAALVDQALYERARLAYQRRAWREAQRELDQLATIAGTPLAEPGAYLACRITIEAHDGAAERCLTEYRKAYPTSPHDLDVLGVLIDLAHRGGGCARASALIDELARDYPRSPLARAWRARCTEGR